MKLITVDDSKECMTLIRRMLASVLPDIEVTEYDPEQQGRPTDEFDWGIYDVLLIDYQLGMHENGLAWIEQFRGAIGFTPVILMTSTGDEYVAASAIKLGACDFIKKVDIDAERLAEMVSAAVADRQRTLSPDETTINSKLDNDAFVFKEVKSTHERTPDGQRIGYHFVRLIGQGPGYELAGLSGRAVCRPNDLNAQNHGRRYD